MDVENRKNQIVASELRLAREEGLELDPAVCAGGRARRHDRNEEDRFPDRALDLVLPQRTLRNRRRVLPQPEIAAELQTQLTVDAQPQSRQCAGRMLIVLARVAEEADELGKFRQ